MDVFCFPYQRVCVSVFVCVSEVNPRQPEMRHSILRAWRVIFRNNRLVSVGGFSHFSFLFPSHISFFLTFSIFLSDHRSSSHFLPLTFKRESILREAVFLFRPLIPCQFIFFSPILSLSPDTEMSNT